MLMTKRLRVSCLFLHVFNSLCLSGRKQKQDRHAGHGWTWATRSLTCDCVQVFGTPEWPPKNSFADLSYC